MKEFQTKAIINAPVDVVWNTITDLTSYPQFDPNCLKIEGAILKGKHIKIYSKLNPRQSYRAKVVEVKPCDRMVWESGLPLNLIKGVRTLRVIAKDDQTTEFHMVEIFNGPGLKIFPNMIPDLNDSFVLFSKGLKRFIESRP